MYLFSPLRIILVESKFYIYNTENEFPQKDTFQLNLILKGLSRLNPHCPKQTSPITPDIILEFYKKLDVTEACDATFWCLSLYAFFLMSRKSNLVPNSVKTFNPNKQLCRSNIEISSEKNIPLINISWSKIIQFGERNLVVPLINIPDSPLCPVKAYHNMISLVPTSAFCLFKHHKVLPVTYFQFQKVLKSLIKSIGKDPDEYSSHSFRRGAFSAEVPSELIQLYEDWSSDAYKKYLRFKLDDKIAVAEKMRNHILNSL